MGWRGMCTGRCAPELSWLTMLPVEVLSWQAPWLSPPPQLPFWQNTQMVHCATHSATNLHANPGRAHAKSCSPRKVAALGQLCSRKCMRTQLHAVPPTRGIQSLTPSGRRAHRGRQLARIAALGRRARLDLGDLVPGQVGGLRIAVAHQRRALRREGRWRAAARRGAGAASAAPSPGQSPHSWPARQAALWLTCCSHVTNPRSRAGPACLDSLLV